MVKTGAKKREKEKKKKKFEVKGSYNVKGNEMKFTKIVDAFNSSHAKEQVLCVFGSKHRLKRRVIKIDSCNEVRE